MASKKILISLPEILLGELDDYCILHNYNRSEFIRYAVRRIIQQTADESNLSKKQI